MSRIAIIIFCVALWSVAPSYGQIQGSPPPAENDAGRVFRQAQERMKRWDWAGAAELFKKAYEMDNKLQAARFGQAACYLKQDRHKEAYPILKEMEKNDPDRPAVLNNLAWIHITSLDPLVRDIEKGLYYARRAMIEAPMDLTVWATLAEGYFQLGDYKEAHRLAQLARNIAKEQGAGEVFELALLIERCGRAIVKEESSGLSGDNGEKEKR